MTINPFKIYKKWRDTQERIRILEEKQRELEKRLAKETQNNKNLQRRMMDYDRKLQYRYHSLLPESQYPEELKKWYFNHTGKRLNLDNPQTYNEKLQWFKLYGVTPQITELVDKYRVREYVKEKIGEEYLIPLLGVWDYPEQIDFSKLPNRFVIKANHGCKYNYIVRDKSEMNLDDFYKKANQWLQEDYAFYSGFELQYHGIPRKLIAEEYIENTDGDLYDYKVWCFNGKAELIQVLTDRRGDMRMDFYNLEWERLPFTYGYPNRESPLSIPENLAEMIEKAEILADGFPHVRVDLYRTNEGKIFFGEMTFTSCSGAALWNPPETDYKLGELFYYYNAKNKEDCKG